MAHNLVIILLGMVLGFTLTILGISIGLLIELTPIPYFGKKRKIVKGYFKRGLKFLRLEPIPLKVYINSTSRYLLKTKQVEISVENLTKAHADLYLNPYFSSKKMYIHNNNDHIRFTVFHELAHHYLATKYPEWQKKQHRLRLSLYYNDGKGFTHGEYRLLPDERMADKIAFLMMKKIK